MLKWAWPQYNLTISQELRGLKIEQYGSVYLAKSWETSPEVRSIFNLAFAHDLTSIIQRGHPSESKHYGSGATVDYISFSLSPEHFWVFALDMDSCPGTGARRVPEQVKFKKVYRHILRQNGIACPPEWRTPQNLHVALQDLAAALEHVRPYVPKLGEMKGSRLRRGDYPFFVDEEDLHSFLVTNWDACPLSSGLRLVGSKVPLNTVASRHGEIDLLAEDDDGHVFVIELKDSARAGSGESPVQQLRRYMTHQDVIQRARQRNGNVFGILMAQDIADKVRRELAQSDDPMIAYEITKTGDGIALQKLAESRGVVGADDIFT